MEVDDEKVERFERWMKDLPFARLGEVTTGPYIAIRGEGGSTRISASWQDLKAAWQGTFKDW